LLLCTLATGQLQHILQAQQGVKGRAGMRPLLFAAIAQDGKHIGVLAVAPPVADPLATAAVVLQLLLVLHII
jgi:hypothetical protein